MQTQSGVHSEDERTMAALAHASVLLNLFTGMGGILAALIIWLTQREKSPWVGFHAQQSFVFQLIVILLTGLVVGVTWVLGFLFSFITVGFGALIAVPFMIITMFLGITAGTGGLVYQVVAAVQVYQGKDFRYVWLGDWLERRR